MERLFEIDWHRSRSVRFCAQFLYYVALLQQVFQKFPHFNFYAKGLIGYAISPFPFNPLFCVFTGREIFRYLRAINMIPFTCALLAHEILSLSTNGVFLRCYKILDFVCATYEDVQQFKLMYRVYAMTETLAAVLSYCYRSCVFSLASNVFSVRYESLFNGAFIAMCATLSRHISELLGQLLLFTISVLDFSNKRQNGQGIWPQMLLVLDNALGSVQNMLSNLKIG